MFEKRIISKSDFAPFKNLKSLFVAEKDHRNTLDTWRVLAIFWIVCQHCIIALGFDLTSAQQLRILANNNFKIFSHASFAVDIFFVLSGYLIGGILIREKKNTGGINIKLFYIRRALRMLPLYYVVIALVIVARSIDFLPPRNYYAFSALPNLLFINNLIPLHLQFLPWSWTLAIEEQFYFLCPILIYFLAISFAKIMKFFAFLLIGIMALHFTIIYMTDLKIYWSIFRTLDLASYDRYLDLIYDKSYVRLSSIVLGVLASYWSHLELDKKMFASKIKSFTWLLLAITVIVYVFNKMDYGPVQANKSLFFECIYRELFCCGFIILMFASLHLKYLSRPFSLKIFHPLFQLSYGIYLIHYIVADALVNSESFRKIINHDIPTPMQILGLGILTFVISAILILPLYIFIERPFINMRARLFSMREVSIPGVANQAKSNSEKC